MLAKVPKTKAQCAGGCGVHHPLLRPLRTAAHSIRFDLNEVLPREAITSNCRRNGEIRARPPTHPPESTKAPPAPTASSNPTEPS